MFAFAVLWRERHKRQLLLFEESQVESCEDKDDAGCRLRRPHSLAVVPDRTVNVSKSPLLNDETVSQ
jgi:hypothetical protein